MDLKETDILGDSIANHWYYRSKAQAMMRFLGIASTRALKVLDVGAGSGFFSRHLLTHGGANEAWCIDISYEKDSDEQESGKPLYFRRATGSMTVDLVMLMDVLEHVDDDIGLLRDYVEKVPSGTRFLLSVPAFEFLWSSHDVFLEHKRRYTLGQVEAVAQKAGLKVNRASYYFAGVFPIAAASRVWERLRRRSDLAPRSQLTRHHTLVNQALRSICSLELPFLRLNRWFGLTVFCLASKP
jgi:SAM-dependent methyltransferase